MPPRTSLFLLIAAAFLLGTVRISMYMSASYLESTTDVSTLKWTGNISDDFNDFRNWNPQKNITTSMDVVIPKVSRFPVLRGPALVHGLIIKKDASLSLTGSSLTVLGRFSSSGTVVMGCTEEVAVGTWQLGGTWEVRGEPGRSSCAVQTQIPYDTLTLKASSSGTVFSLPQDLAVTNRLEVKKGILDLQGHSVRAKKASVYTTVRMRGDEGLVVDAFDVTGTGALGRWVMRGNGNKRPDAILLTTQRFANLIIQPVDPTETFMLPFGASVTGLLRLSGGKLAVQAPASLTVQWLELKGGNLDAAGSVTVSQAATFSKGTYTATGRGSHLFQKLTLAGGNIRAEGATGLFRVTGKTELLNGSFFAPASLSLRGEFVKGAGTFDPRRGTVILEGAQQIIRGFLTFYNLTKTVTSHDTLTVQAGAQIAVKGTLTLRGTGKGILTVRSSTDGIPWLLSAPGTRILERLKVQDTIGTNTIPLVCKPVCTDGGGNRNWTFGR